REVTTFCRNCNLAAIFQQSAGWCCTCVTKQVEIICSPADRSGRCGRYAGAVAAVTCTVTCADEEIIGGSITQASNDVAGSSNAGNLRSRSNIVRRAVGQGVIQNTGNCIPLNQYLTVTCCCC